MRALNAVFLPAVFLLACSFCRAQNQTALSGNWLLTGSWDLKAGNPRLVLSLGVNGNNVFGNGDLQTLCPAESSGTGLTFYVHGQITSEGTFVLANMVGPTISISGKVPEPGSIQWSGTFRFVRIRKTTKCSPTVSGDFVATPLPPVNGRYSGTLHLMDRSSVTVTLDVNQGELTTFESEAGVVLGELPLSGTLTVVGSIYPTETLTADVSHHSSSRIQGDELLLVFPLDNGAHVLLAGQYTDASENELSVVLTYSGQDVGAGGLLTRR